MYTYLKFGLPRVMPLNNEEVFCKATPLQLSLDCNSNEYSWKITNTFISRVKWMCLILLYFYELYLNTVFALHEPWAFNFQVHLSNFLWEVWSLSKRHRLNFINQFMKLDITKVDKFLNLCFSRLESEQK